MDVLIDTNLVIYRHRQDDNVTRSFLLQHTISCSAITKLEALGYHAITQSERSLLESFFEATPVHAVTPLVIDRAISLRQRKKMTIGDALIGATALVHDLVLATRNAADFEWIEGLQVIDPYESRES